jgi:putative ABC transport system permease protein
MVDTFVMDLRHAARKLARTPGFVAVAVLTLALGIGANTAVFSLVNAVLFRPLPTEGLDRLVVIKEDLPDLNLFQVDLAPAEVVDLADRRDVFQAVTGFRQGDRTLTGYGDPARIAAVATLGDFGGVFGVRPHLGSFYGAEQSVDGPTEVAVIGYGLWQRLSGGDPGFLGTTIELNGVPHEVIGVMPPEFRYPRGVQVWTPFAYTAQWHQNRGSLFKTTVARLHPGVTPDQLTAQLDVEVSRWNEAYHPGGSGKVLTTTGFIEFLAGPLRLILMVLMGAVVFVLLIAAANVGSLQLVRASGRGRELAVHSALGAGRGRIARRLFFESTILAVAGGAGGLLVGVLTLRLFERWGPAQAMYLSEIPLDTTVLLFTGAVALLTAIAFGTLPALRASRVQPQEALRESGRGASAGVRRHRLLQASVITQVALALVLLLGSGLMIRTLSGLLAADPGFEGQDVLTGHVSIPAAMYDVPGRIAFFDALLERVRSLPGVEYAALAWGLPFTGHLDSSSFDIVGRPSRPGEPERHHEARIVSGDYFRTLGIPLLGGRSFDDTERSGQPGVVVIDETFAEQFFPGEDPVGQEIAGYTGERATIIGVVGRIDRSELGEAPKATGYYSYRQLPWGTLRSVAVRTDQPVGAMTAMLRSTVAELDPSVPLYDVQTMRGRLEQTLGPRRLAMLALGVFAALSLLLATLGVYGLMRYTTNERTREISIRMALGAERRDVLVMVLRQAAVLVAAGLAIGMAAALLVTRAMQGILYGVTASDPVTFIAAGVLLAAAGLLSSYLPARRAAGVDPMISLKEG